MEIWGCEIGKMLLLKGVIGEKVISREYVEKLELADFILEKANALYAASQAWFL